MLVLFDKSFSKSLDKLKIAVVKKSIELIIVQIESAGNLKEIGNIKKMEGFKGFYRIRIGDYRLGFELENARTVRLIIIAHRKDIYKVFP